MTKKQALKILVNHQKWRLGSGLLEMTDAKELTAALDFAIEFLKYRKEST